MDVHLVAILQGIGSLGAAAGPIFGILWWLERSERKEALKAGNILLDRAITAIESSKRTQSKMALLLGQADRAEDD